MKNHKGIFIMLDSGEGAGKTTQLIKAKEFFGDSIVLTREPGGSPYAEEIRSVILNSPHAKQADPKTLFMLFWAARVDHLKNTIIPALDAGKIVISDRFDSSTFAYQIVAQGARHLEKLFWQMRELSLGDYVPDLYIYLDIDPKIGLGRKTAQKTEINHFEERPFEFHEKLRVGFREFLGHVPHEVIDASASLDRVWENFKQIIDGQLRLMGQ